MIPLYKLTGRMGNQMFQFAYIYAQYRDGWIPDIYCQDDIYWRHYANEIKQMFSDGISYDERVGVQLRRGDYVGNSFYVDLSSTDYYQKALAQFPNDRFLVFCKDGQDPEKDKQDREWAIDFFTKLIGRDRFDFYDDEDSVKAFNAFASCKHTIMANGSFSWWAAYLNPNPDKIVIAPKRWYSDRVERTKCPSKWIKL